MSLTGSVTVTTGCGSEFIVEPDGNEVRLSTVSDSGETIATITLTQTEWGVVTGAVVRIFPFPQVPDYPVPVY